MSLLRVRGNPRLALQRKPHLRSERLCPGCQVLSPPTLAHPSPRIPLPQGVHCVQPNPSLNCQGDLGMHPGKVG